KIAVIDHGKVIALGTANELKDQVGGERLELTVGSSADTATARSALVPVALGEPVVDERARRLTVPVSGGAEVLVEAVRLLDAESVHVLDIGLRRPTLDDVFLTLTGHAAEAEQEQDGAGASGGARRRG
ncbi:daunorubicin/doxorubicin resistance ABC transporter ATP-binding protein DrrA, partial [Actinosynnema sp. NPDC050801]